MPRGYYHLSLVALLYTVLSLFTFVAGPTDAKAAPTFIKANGSQLTLNDQPIILKGSSFYPHEGPWQYMWTQWNGENTAKDLARSIELGNNTVRILVPYGGTYGWIDENTGEVRPEYLNQLKQMVQIAGNLNQRVILTLFDFYGAYPAAGSHDELSNLNYLRTIVSAFRDDDRVLAWDLHNEPDNYGPWKDKNDPETALNWLARMTAAARAIDPNHLFTVGPGRYESFSQTDSAGNSLLSLSDFVSIHSYNARDLNNIIARVKALSNKPVILEEVGWPTGPIFSNDFTESTQLENYKLIVEAAKNQQVSGVIQWQLMDLLPYGVINFDTFQDYYGLIRRNGALKPAATIWRDDYKATMLPAPGVSTTLAYTQQPLDSTPRPLYFPQTDHYVATPLKEFWRRAGGWEVFGYPITEAFSPDDGKTVIQYFEKARFEYYPERRFSPDFTKYDGISKYLYLIDRGFLGTEQTAGRNFAPGQRLPDGPNYRWFDQTQHSLTEPFYSYWQNHMGADVFGPPISEPFEETNPEDGGTRLVQYFGRVRLEFHPELAGTAYAVSVASLGVEQARARGWLTQANPGYGLPAFQNQPQIQNQAQSLFADPAFERTWERTDQPVAEGKAGRTWLWGEQPFYAGQEPYTEANGGQRLVQYFDKSRMEITHPAGDHSSKWYVTNGLLAKEMITGQMQLGDNQWQTLAPPAIPLAGDPAEANPDAPTYASLTKLVSAGRSPNRLGQPVNTSLSKDGTTGPAPDTLAGSVRVGTYNEDTGHNIAEVFWNFMINTRGPLYENGQIVQGDVIDWTFSIGLPISEPYWTRAKVGGVEKDVLVQAFERRVLTYTPSNSAAFQVEMGNVGRHYYQWRYSSAAPAQGTGDPSVLNSVGGLVWRREINSQAGGVSTLLYAPQAGNSGSAGALAASSTQPSVPVSSGSSLVYTSPDLAGRLAVHTNDFKGNDKALTYGLAPAFNANGSQLAFNTFSGPWQLDLNLYDSKTGQIQKIQSGVGLSSAWSPDGKTLAFISYASKQSSLALRSAGGDIKLLQSYDINGVALTGLNWSPDNRYLTYTVFQLGGRDGGIVVNVGEVWVADTISGTTQKITGGAARATFSPDGRHLAFVGWGQNNLMLADWTNGTASNVRVIEQARGCRDECANVGTPAFSPDSQWLVATATGGGLSATRVDGSTSINLTNPANTATDRDPKWVRG